MGLFPDEVRKSAGPEELLRRLDECQRLSAQSADMSLPPDLRMAAKMRGQAVLSAPVQKAATVQRPGAPVRKAKADPEDGPVPVFDADGNLIGICKPGDITPLTGTKQASPPDDSSQVTKAARAAGKTVVYDSRFRPYAVRAGSVQWPGGRVAKQTAAGVRAQAGRKTPGETRLGGAGDRVVVKAAGWRDVHNRAGDLVGVIKAADVIKPVPEAERRARADTASYCNVFDAQGGRFGFAYRPNILPVRRGR
jgi:hypothetical protein